MRTYSYALPIILSAIALMSVGFFIYSRYEMISSSTILQSTDVSDENMTLDTELQHPLTIASLRSGTYPGSSIEIVEKLSPGSNYDRYLTSYQSEGLKIYALLTIPRGEMPVSGWPAIVFNHGYIPPAQYRTTEKYIAYTDGFSRNGYILFRPDYRGHGKSEGVASGGYGSNAYTIDVLNALSSLKNHPDVDENRVGMWGHSMGGYITLRNMVVDKSIKAGVIWAGVVASYPDMLNNWRRSTFTPSPLPSGARRWRQLLVDEYGAPEENAPFWDSISANAFLADISGPVQLHHGTADSSVPVQFSQKLETQLTTAGKPVEYYEYQGDDHNLSQSFNTAMRRSIEFFDRHVKGTEK